MSGRKIIAGLTEAVAVARGEKEPARVHEVVATTVDEARVEAALRKWFKDGYVAVMGEIGARMRRDMSRALAAADAVRDQQGASPTGPGWSAEPEPVPVSAAGGDHPSRKFIAEFVGDLREAMSRRKIARAGTDEPGEAWDDIAQIMCTGMWERGPLFGEFVVHALSHPAQAIKARSAETQGGSAEGESAAGEAGAPQVAPFYFSPEIARHIAQIARERDEARAERDSARRVAERWMAAHSEAGAEAMTLREEVERLRSAFALFLGVVLTTRKSNTHEWMAGLAEDVNTAAAQIGTSDRFIYDGKDHLVRAALSPPPTPA